MSQRNEMAAPRSAWALCLLAAIGLLAAVIRLRLLDVPLDRDEGEYAYFGQLLLAGVPPYADAYNLKAPGIYAAEVAQSTLRVNLIDPGRVRTAMRAKAYPGEAPESVPAPDEIADAFVELASEACTRHGELVQLRRAHASTSSA